MKTCCVDIVAPHYRFDIFSKMQEELSCDFYFGQPFGSISKIKTIPLSSFNTHAELLKNIDLHFLHGYWQCGVIGLLRKDYNVYILGGDIICLSTWLFMFLNRLFFHKKVLLWGHGWYGRESSFRAFINKIYLSLADHIMVYGDRAKRLMIQNGSSSRRITPIHNSLSYSKQLDVIKRIPDNNPFLSHFKNNHPVVIFTGRLTPVKKINMIVQALSMLKNEGVFVNCVLLGDGPEMQLLKDLVEKLKLNSNFWFYGACYDELTIGSMYWYASVCVSPGNVGLTAIHSLTYGCPVITHNDFSHQMPEFEAITPGKTGDFFECENCSALKETIKKWIDLSTRNKQSIRKACQDTVQKGWTPEYQIRVIKECCSLVYSE